MAMMRFLSFILKIGIGLNSKCGCAKASPLFYPDIRVSPEEKRI
jgi:hypothetical protein